MKGLLIVLIVSLIAIRYLFVPGFLPTHDGEYHLIRFYEFGRMIANGHFFPRWASGLNSGYGVPLFTFFYPLPNYIGSLFHFFGWSLSDSFRLTMAVGYITAIVASYFWLKRLYGVFPAVAGSIIGAFTPYWFVDIFVRGSVGEVLALGFVFMALSCIAYKKRTLLALAIAGIILSHNIMVMIFLPILLLYAWMTDRSMLRWFFVGVMLTSYFWAPALVERGYVVGLNTVNYKDHFPEIAQLLIPSWGTGLSGLGYSLDEMSYQIGVIPLVLFIASFFLVPRSLFVTAMGIAIFFMLQLSAPVWNIFAPLALLQYPWRLLSIVVVASPFFAASLVSRFHSRFFAVGMVMLAIAFSYFYTKPVLYAPRTDDYYLSRREFTDGTSSLGNGFSTRWMSWKPDRPKARMEIISGVGSVALGSVHLITDAMIRIHVAYYPGWRVAIDGKDSLVYPDSEGMITISVPKGDHSIAVNFNETPLRLVADFFSLAFLLWLFIKAARI